MLCFDKLTGVDNNRKTFLKYFVLWECIFTEVYTHFEITDKSKAPTYQGIQKVKYLYYSYIGLLSSANWWVLWADCTKQVLHRFT